MRKKLSAFTDTTIILFCWRRKYAEFFRNYSTLKVKVEIMRKHTAALEGRWLVRGLTALQIVRTLFLGPRPRLFAPPPPPPTPDTLHFRVRVKWLQVARCVARWMNNYAKNAARMSSAPLHKSPQNDKGNRGFHLKKKRNTLILQQLGLFEI